MSSATEFYHQLWKATNSLCCLQVSMESPWPTTQLHITHYWHWRFHCVASDVWMEVCHLNYLVIPFRFFSYKYIFYKVSTVIVFHLTLRMGISFACPFLFFSLHAFFPSPFHSVPDPHSYLYVVSINFELHSD